MPRKEQQDGRGQGDLLPPQNEEAELGVLGAILLDNAVLPDVLAILRAEDFYADYRQILFRAMADLHQQGKPVEPIVLSEELRKRGQFDKVGGDEGLFKIVGSVPHAANAKYHAEIVRGKSITRAQIHTYNEGLKEAYSNAYSGDELVERQRNRLEAIPLGGGSKRAEAILVRLSDVQPVPIEWLWPGRFPLGKPSLLVGDPGLGKSLLSIAMASVVSRGGTWFDCSGECAERGSVILLSAEDTLADTIRPRLDAAGGDPGRVLALTSMRGSDGKLRSFNLGSDLPKLEDALTSVGDARLIIIDPVSAYLGSTDEHKNAEIRGLIGPLSDLAERHRVAVVLVTHLNKGAGAKAIYRATGSLAFVAAARMAWLVARDRSTPGRRLLLNAKANITEEPKGLAYRIVDGQIQFEVDPISLTADEVLAQEGQRSPSDNGRGPIPVKTRKAMDWIRERLVHGMQRHGVVRRAAEEAGFSTGTFYNAVRLLGIQEPIHDGRKYLQLPPDDDAEEAPQANGVAHEETNGHAAF